MRTLRTVRNSSPILFAALAAMLVACSGEAGTTSSGSTSSAAAAETVATADASVSESARGGGRPHGGRPGPDFLIGAALQEPINLTADQKKTIDGLLQSEHQGPRPFDKTRAAALAASVRAGKVDATATTVPPVADMTAHRAAEASALTTLHSTLTATQRKALVDAMEARAAEHEKADGDHGHSHGPPGAERGGAHKPMGHLLEGLDATAAQEQEIKSKLDAARPAPPSDSERASMKAEHEAMHAAMKSKLETFAGDGFDATAFVTPPAGAMKRVTTGPITS